MRDKVDDIKELVPLVKRFNELETEICELNAPVKRKLKLLSLKSYIFHFLNYSHLDIILGVDSWLQKQIIWQQSEEVNLLRERKKKLLREIEEYDRGIKQFCGVECDVKQEEMMC